jgi:hypothetical protein
MLYRIKFLFIKLLIFGATSLLLLLLSASIYLLLSPRPDLTIIGPVNLADGIGSQAYDHYRLLKQHGKVNLLSTQCQKGELSFWEYVTLWNPFQPLGKIILIDEPLKRHDMALWSELFSYNSRPLHLLNYLTLLLTRSPDQIFISYSMFESDRIPDNWVKQLNQYYDAVAVPDPYLVEAYVASGVTKPIFVLPLGVTYPQSDPQARKEPRYPFLFGNLSKTEERKNTFKMIYAFHLAFGNDPSVRLHVNSRDHDRSEYKKIMEFLSTYKVDNISYTIEKLSSAEYQRRLNSFDCYISISRGEGFSITPRQAMERAIPTIVTDSTAQKTIAASGLVRVVPCPEKSPAYYPFTDKPIGSNEDCTVEEVVAAYRDLYDHYDHYLAQGGLMRKWALEYRYEALLPRYSALLLKPKEIKLGREDLITDNYLVTTSEILYKKYRMLQDS